MFAILRASEPRIRSREIRFRSLKNSDKQHFLHDLHNVPFQVAEIFDDVDDRLDTCLIVYMRTFFVSTHL